MAEHRRLTGLRDLEALAEELDEEKPDVAERIRVAVARVDRSFNARMKQQLEQRAWSAMMARKNAQR